MNSIFSSVWVAEPEWLALQTWNIRSGFEFSWRQNSAHDCIVLHCTEPFLIIRPLSCYGLNDVERDVKYQIIIINILFLCSFISFHSKQLLFRNIAHNKCCFLHQKSIDIFLFSTNTYSIQPNYRIYPYKHSQAIPLSSDYNKSIFSLLLYKGICCGYSSELHRLVDAIQMSTQHICFYKENQKKIA